MLSTSIRRSAPEDPVFWTHGTDATAVDGVVAEGSAPEPALADMREPGLGGCSHDHGGATPGIANTAGSATWPSRSRASEVAPAAPIATTRDRSGNGRLPGPPALNLRLPTVHVEVVTVGERVSVRRAPATPRPSSADLFPSNRTVDAVA